jgi:Carboxypeptidase regulatory-like domain
MKKMISFLIIASAFLVVLSAQSGGNYQLTQSVVGNGGGEASGGIYSLGGTAGQSVTEESSQSLFQLKSGFWQSSLVPTASSVSISGRVLSFLGRGLMNASVSLTDSNGITRTARTSSFGYYRFNEIESGQIVIIAVKSKRYQYQSQVISVDENLTEVNFTPIGNNSKEN